MDSDSDREDETAMEDEAPCKFVPDTFLASTNSVPDIFLEPTNPRSSDMSLCPSCPTILSLETVLLRTRGDFWASSWLAFKRFEVADMADSCLLSDMAVAEEAIALEYDPEDFDSDENCLVSEEVCFEAEETCLDSDDAIWLDEDSV